MYTHTHTYTVCLHHAHTDTYTHTHCVCTHAHTHVYTDTLTDTHTPHLHQSPGCSRLDTHTYTQGSRLDTHTHTQGVDAADYPAFPVSSSGVLLSFFVVLRRRHREGRGLGGRGPGGVGAQGERIERERKWGRGARVENGGRERGRAEDEVEEFLLRTEKSVAPSNGLQDLVGLLSLVDMCMVMRSHATHKFIGSVGDALNPLLWRLNCRSVVFHRPTPHMRTWFSRGPKGLALSHGNLFLVTLPLPPPCLLPTLPEMGLGH